VLADDLTAHRTAALRTMLAERPDAALVTVVHALTLAVFYDEGESALALHAVMPCLRAEGLDEGAAMKRLLQLRGIWATDLPEQPDTLWDWLLGRDTDTLLALLAHCTACTIKPERGAATDRIAAAVALDMTRWWQPTASYFTRVPKPLILAAVSEGKSGAAADDIAALKKGDMAAKAVELLSGSGWLPALLKAA
jgi:ParB family chromosome partitioning protein